MRERRVEKFTGDRRGFSLIELIIVIAVMSLMTAGSFTVISHIRLANTKKAVEEVSSVLSRMQVNSMSKADKPVMFLYRLGADYYVRTVTTSELDGHTDDEFLTTDGSLLCSTNVTITRVDAAGAHALSDTDYIKVVYKRSGVFDTAKTNATQIKFDGTGSYTIKLLAGTGKHVIE